MPIEQTIQTIIEEYGSTIWIGFVTLVVTGFALTTLKGFVEDLVYYFRARLSDIGYSQRIYYNNEIYLVRSIHFKFIVIYDDKKVIRIPTKLYMNGPIIFPQPRYDDFNEKKYHEPPWDGATERRDRPPSPPPGPPPNPKQRKTGERRSGEIVKPEVDYSELRKQMVNLMIGVLIGPEGASNILPSYDDDMKEQAEDIRSKLSEEDFNTINTGLAAFMRMNTMGKPLTKEDMDRARQMSEVDGED